MRWADRSRTLAARLTWTLVLSAGMAAAIAIVVGMLVADVLLRRHAETTAAAALTVLVAEFDENPAYIADLDEEKRELGIDLPVAVTRAGQRVAGASSLTATSASGCDTTPDGAIVCARALATQPDTRVLVGVPADRVHAHRGPFVTAAAVVLALVLVGAAVFGIVTARRLLAPLDALRRAVLDVDPGAPGTVVLPPPSRFEELRGLRGALAALLGRLEVELDRSRRFASNAAHELRTPLARLRAEVELAAETTSDPSAQESFLRSSRTAARLGLLTERLLVLSTPREALGSAQATSMCQLVEDLVGERPDAEATRLRIEVPTSDGLVRGDPVLLAAALDNAVDNALKFSDGPVLVRVLEPNGSAEVIVEIEDSGPGIDQARADALFEPFVRGTDVRGKPGHGLGLALCAHVARACGGSVSFDRARSSGALLRIALPAVGLG